MKIKKEDIKKTTPEKISELIDLDGAAIEGDDVDNNDSQIKTAPQQTTDDYEESGVQPNGYFYNAAYLTGGNKVRESISKDRMGNLIEDLVSKNKPSSLVKKVDKRNDVIKKEVGNLDELSDDVSSKLKDLIELCKNLKGTESVIVLNELIKGLDIKKIPNNLLTKIKTKLNA